MAGPAQLFKEIKAGKFKSLYYFFGPEDYRRTEAEKYIGSRFLPDLQRSTNYHRLDARKISAQELIAQLSNYPILGEKEVYVVTGIESFKPNEQDQIFNFLKAPDTNRIIIFSSPSKKTPQKKSAFFKKISEAAMAVEFNKLDQHDTRRHITKTLTANSISIESEALSRLAGLIDGDRGGLEGELKKLIDYKDSGGTITVEDIKEVCAGYEVFNMFEVGDVLVQGSPRKTLKVIKKLLGSGVSIDMLTILLIQHFISLYLVKNGKNPVGRRAFLIHKFRAQAGQFGNAQLESIIISLADGNAQLRQQELPKQLILETLALSLSVKS